MKFKKCHNKILVHMETFDVTIDHILVHFLGSIIGLYVSFQICLYEMDANFLTNSQWRTHKTVKATLSVSSSTRSNFVKFSHLSAVLVGCAT